jgi:hypothetical protein
MLNAVDVSLGTERGANNLWTTAITPELSPQNERRSLSKRQELLIAVWLSTACLGLPFNDPNICELSTGRKSRIVVSSERLHCRHGSWFIPRRDDASGGPSTPGLRNDSIVPRDPPAFRGTHGYRASR